MSLIFPVLDALAKEIADLTAQVGDRVEVASMNITDRRRDFGLGRPGLQSPNRTCRLITAQDNWIALNLARPDDVDLLPAWLGLDFGPLAWSRVEAVVGERCAADLVSEGAALGLPVARLGEAQWEQLQAPVIQFSKTGSGHRSPRLRVVDLSALWAGPACGAILAEMGAEVVRIESLSRPDPTRAAAPGHFNRLNGAKAELSLDLTQVDDLSILASAVQAADILITSARPRALAGLGLTPDVIFAVNSGLVWVAITGHGFESAPLRVAFGDDAAVAGGLVRWTGAREPRFAGDALADPITGLMAAAGALRGLMTGGGMVVDAALSACAAGAIAALRDGTAAA